MQYSVTTSVIGGNGSIDVTRTGTDNNTITLTANYDRYAYFIRYDLNGVTYESKNLVTQLGSGIYTASNDQIVVTYPTDSSETANPFTVTIERPITATLVLGQYNIGFRYVSEWGSATYSKNTNGLLLTATPKSGNQFLGWYLDGNLLSTEKTFLYTGAISDMVFFAEFEPVYSITSTIDGKGSVNIERDSQDQNRVTITVYPDANWHFLRASVGDGVNPLVIYEESNFTTRLEANSYLSLYFEEDSIFHIDVTCNIVAGSVYISHNDDYDGYTSVLRVRPVSGYNFLQWSDGNTENPRTLVVTENITLIAIYQKITDNIGNYRYRAFVKDQLNLTARPKAFMTIDTVDLKRDLLTKANSSFSIYEDDIENVNNGDVVVIYDPKGKVLYQGVITSKEGKKLTSSQMTSFYKGEWIYSTYSEPYVSADEAKKVIYLEDEVKKLLTTYSQGKMYNSDYTDPLVAKRLGGITVGMIDPANLTKPEEVLTKSKLVTDLDEYGDPELDTEDMESWLYSLYDTYNVIPDFKMEYSGTNSVTIRKGGFNEYGYEIGSLKVSDNIYAIKDISPVETIEETNRLIIYGTKLGKIEREEQEDALLDLIDAIKSKDDERILATYEENNSPLKEIIDIDGNPILDKDQKLTNLEQSIRDVRSNYDLETDTKEALINGYNAQIVSYLKSLKNLDKIKIQDRPYRATYVATKNEILKEPKSIDDRFEITNTKIVYSYDPLDDLKAAYLPTTMYNHKLTFTLILKNFVYEFDEFILGRPIEVWYKDQYYNTVLTGYEIKKESNKDITEVTFTCGLVRQKLTKILTLGKKV